jgi:hypothetical protein
MFGQAINCEIDLDEITTEMMTAISMDSFLEIWNAPENERWDDFIKERLECIDKENDVSSLFQDPTRQVARMLFT